MERANVVVTAWFLKSFGKCAVVQDVAFEVIAHHVVLDRAILPNPCDFFSRLHGEGGRSELDVAKLHHVGAVSRRVVAVRPIIGRRAANQYRGQYRVYDHQQLGRWAAGSWP
jgi:hypothetical protein